MCVEGTTVYVVLGMVTTSPYGVVVVVVVKGDVTVVGVTTGVTVYGVLGMVSVSPYGVDIVV